jgi:hypothetical protein
MGPSEKNGWGFSSHLLRSFHLFHVTCPGSLLKPGGNLLRLRNMVPGVGWVFDEDGAACAGHFSSRATHSEAYTVKVMVIPLS